MADNNPNNKFGTRFERISKSRIINPDKIQWIDTSDKCLELCMKSNGCTKMDNTHTFCEKHNPKFYEELTKNFYKSNSQ